METKLVNYKLPLELLDKIEALSKGNKTALVISLLEQSINIRMIDEKIREEMYITAKREIFEDSGEPTPKQLRSLIDGLHI